MPFSAGTNDRIMLCVVIPVFFEYVVLVMVRSNAVSSAKKNKGVHSKGAAQSLSKRG